MKDEKGNTITYWGGKEEKDKVVTAAEFFHGEYLNRHDNTRPGQVFPTHPEKWVMECGEKYSSLKIKETLQGLIGEIENKRDGTHPDSRYNMAIEIIKSKM